MIVIGPFKYNSEDSVWTCDDYNGELCHTGLQAALDTELETDHSYELRIYPKRPRVDVSKLKLKIKGSEYFDTYENLEDENGEHHELDCRFASIISNKFAQLENKNGEITFYVRPLDLGLTQKVPCEGFYDVDSSELEIIAEDGTSTIIDIDLEDAVWS